MAFGDKLSTLLKTLRAEAKRRRELSGEERRKETKKTTFKPPRPKHEPVRFPTRTLEATGKRPKIKPFPPIQPLDKSAKEMGAMFQDPLPKKQKFHRPKEKRVKL